MSVFFDKDSRSFFLDGKNVSYIFHINEWDYAEHLYFGAKIPHDDIRFTRSVGSGTAEVVPEGGRERAGSFNSYCQFGTELSFFGTGDYREPAVSVINRAGDRLSSLLYDGYDILPNKPEINGMPSLDGGETLVLHLRDRYTGFCADLYYTVYDDCDVIARRIVYTNRGDSEVELRRAYSFSMTLPENKYDVMTLYGTWGRERHIERTPLVHGVLSVGSKRCASSAVLNPFMALMSKGTTETSGEVYGISLVYSSSFVLKAEGCHNGDTLVTGGIDDFGFSWRLARGESLETPEAVLAFSNSGTGAMSRALHDAFREHLIPKDRVKAPRPLLVNNWEGTYFAFTTEKLKGIVDNALGLGIDTFVLDDGWFGKRNDDTSSLGDWFVNEDKFGGSIDLLIDYVHENGMKFGLWFEPEMISEDSELYRAHPDYAVAVPGRVPCVARNQLMLDLTRADVRDNVVSQVNRMLSEHKIEYVKWDYNRNISDAYTASLPPERQGEFAHRYALGVYDLFERIVKGNPDVFFEGCSSGGARFDPAVLAYFPQIWTSDDSDAEERTKIQYGTSMVYPLSSMSCHVSVCPNHQVGRTTPLRTRAAIAQLGATGYELDTSLLTDAEKEEIKQQTAFYRENEKLILEGDLYRIDNPFEGNYFTFAVVSKDKSEALVTTYRRLNEPNRTTSHLRLAGLDPEKRYLIRELGVVCSGKTLMSVGIARDFSFCDFDARQYRLTEAE